jgi:hypothetical protein
MEAVPGINLTLLIKKLNLLQVDVRPLDKEG